MISFSVFTKPHVEICGVQKYYRKDYRELVFLKSYDLFGRRDPQALKLTYNPQKAE